METSETNSVELLDIRWDIGILNKLLGYVFKKSKNISNLNLRNVQKLLLACNFEDYDNRPMIMERVDFILKALKARLDEKMADEDIVLQYCTPDFLTETVEDILKNLDRYRRLTYKEIEFITKFVEDRLTYGIFVNKAKDMKKIIEHMEDGEFETYGEVNNVISDWLHDYLLAKRHVNTVMNESMLDFNDPNLTERVGEINGRLGDKSSILITGIQMLNEMLSPGFRPSKLYMFLGLTGGFKSAMLLKIILDCAKYNAKRYVPKREGAKPYVLYLTMENTIDESFARVWNMEVENSDVETNKPSDIVAKLKQHKIVGNKDIGILMVYKPNMSISTAEVRDMIDEIEATGKEVILLSFDYIKRIRPQERSKDEKEMLKNITNELRQIAIDYSIPVVSAHQFNRNGLSVVNNAMRDGKADLAKYLGGENVGSAYEVMENPDMSIALNLERKKDNQLLYLTFFRLKERYRPSTKLNYFNQPFQRDNEFQLVDDVLKSKPLGIISLDTNMDGVDANNLFNSRGRSTHKNMLMDDDFLTDDTFDLDPVI